MRCLCNHIASRRAGDPKLLQHLPDTAAFLQLLHNLHSSNTGSGDSAASSSAAGGLHPLLALAGHEGEQRGSGNAAAAGAGAGAAGDAPASGAAGSGSGGGGAADRFSSDLPEVRAAMGLFRCGALAGTADTQGALAACTSCI